MSNDPVRYLGDALYASWDGYQIRLDANDLEYPSDTVYLNDEVIDSFIQMIKDIREVDQL